MKILTVAATPFFSSRGSHIRIYNEAKYLQKMGAEVLVCTYHNGQVVKGLKTERIGNVSWYKKTSPGFSWGKLWCDLKMIFLVARVMKRFEPEIIHAHLFEGLGVSWFGGLMAFQSGGFGKRKAPIVLDLQGDLESEFDSYNKKYRLAKRIFVAFSRWLVKKAQVVVASSERAAKSIREKYGIEATVIGDGVDVELMQKERSELEKEKSKAIFEAKNELKKIEKWKKGSRLLIYAGGMEQSKGAGELLEAFTRQAPKNWKLLMFGDGQNRETYKHKYLSTYVSASVYFCQETGYFELPRYLKLAEGAIDPKRNSTESSGKVPIYMASGLPVICFQNDFNRKLLGEKGNYLNHWKELGVVLERLPKEGRISYNLSKLSEYDETRRLYGIMVKVKTTEY